MGETNFLCKICKCWQTNVCFIKDPEICIDCLRNVPHQVNAMSKLVFEENSKEGQCPKTRLNPQSKSKKMMGVKKDE